MIWATKSPIIFVELTGRALLRNSDLQKTLRVAAGNGRCYLGALLLGQSWVAGRPGGSSLLPSKRRLASDFASGLPSLLWPAPPVERSM